ncbi:MAG TPA: ABC transporter permease [Polyangiaceae bacterium]|nr:ABC transporter permease [Polyangiaceae bacterium]
MRALERKLFRDLRRMAVQVLAIALVLASGIALFIGTMTTYRSLRLSEAHYYEQQRFAQVWSRLARAPLSLSREVRAISGVAAVEARIVTPAILDVGGLDAPASALLVSIPDKQSHALNGLYVRNGRHIAPGRPREVLVSQAFAEMNQLRPGDRLFAVACGHRLELTIVGIALSPEYVMQIPPGGLSPDDQRFAVLWMSRSELEGIADLRGAFNDIALELAPRASEAAVVREVDRVLAPYGGHGAYGRKSQMSHAMLEEHIDQLRGIALIVPGIFLAIAAFLVNVVLARIVATEREQIGMLKAFGYSNVRVAAHYFVFSMIVVACGVAISIPVGAWLGRVMSVFYATFFRFPVLVFRIEAWVVALAALVAVLAASVGALGTLRRVASMPPIVAMAAEVPLFSRTSFERLASQKLLPPAFRMIFRNVTRRPARALSSLSGMAFAVAVVVLGSASSDGIERSENVQFQAAQREDLALNLAHARALGTLGSFTALPGVRRLEPYRLVPARVEHQSTAQDVALLGLPRGGTLRRAIGSQYELAALVPNAVFITAWLGKQFGLRRGDLLPLEIREGRRRTVTVRIAGFVDEPLGEAVYMELGGLGRLLGEPETYSGMNISVDPALEHELYGVLKRTPAAVAVSLRRGTLANFRGMSARAVIFIRQIEVVFAVIIAFGVVYNSAHIALAERSRELATLRVLGFTRAEISLLLLGEIALLAAPAIPLGLLVGYGLTGFVVKAMSSTRMHIPLVVETSTFAFAIVIFAVSALVSALLVRRRLDALDLMSVLKARE